MQSPRSHRILNILIAALISLVVITSLGNEVTIPLEPTNQLAQNRLESIEREQAKNFSGVSLSSQDQAAGAVEIQSPTTASETEAPVPADSAASQGSTSTSEAAEANGMTSGETSSTADIGDYNYTAGPGDSYSVLARKAVQTYGLSEKISLSQAQLIAAETYLTQAGHDSLLNLGQSVIIIRSDVANAVARAKALTLEGQQQWQQFVSLVDYDTNEVGN